MRLIPSRTDFLRDARQADLYPLRAEFLFDADTAVTAYAKLREPPFGFLLESVVGGEKWARYTFLGSRPRYAWRIEPGGEATSTWTPATGWHRPGALPLFLFLLRRCGAPVRSPP